jgi:hypothetical protein
VVRPQDTESEGVAVPTESGEKVRADSSTEPEDKGAWSGCSDGRCGSGAGEAGASSSSSAGLGGSTSTTTGGGVTGAWFADLRVLWEPSLLTVCWEAYCLVSLGLRLSGERLGVFTWVQVPWCCNHQQSSLVRLAVPWQ